LWLNVLSYATAKVSEKVNRKFPLQGTRRYNL